MRTMQTLERFIARGEQSAQAQDRELGARLFMVD